jgi:hypothetical protein
MRDELRQLGPHKDSRNKAVWTRPCAGAQVAAFAVIDSTPATARASGRQVDRIVE